MYQKHEEALPVFHQAALLNYLNLGHNISNVVLMDDKSSVDGCCRMSHITAQRVHKDKDNLRAFEYFFRSVSIVALPHED